MLLSLHRFLHRLQICQHCWEFSPRGRLAHLARIVKQFSLLYSGVGVLPLLLPVYPAEAHRLCVAFSMDNSISGRDVSVAFTAHHVLNLMYHPDKRQVALLVVKNASYLRNRISFAISDATIERDAIAPVRSRTEQYALECHPPKVDYDDFTEDISLT